MTRLLLALICALPACGAPAVPPDAEATPDADQQLLLRRLSSRHPPSDCAALTAGLAHPAAALRRAVDEDAGPPWAPILSSRCLVRGHAAAEEAALTRWLGDPAYAGVARVVVRELPALAEEPVVVRLGAAALAGPERGLAAEILGGDARGAVRGLVGR
jgi:hypothetical protein